MLRKYPAQQLARTEPNANLSYLIGFLLQSLIRPFLERQLRYEQLPPLKADWAVVRQLCRDVAREVAVKNELPAVADLLPTADPP